jgi:hypothetical protein
MNKVQQLRVVITKLVPMIASRGIIVTQIGAQAFVQTDMRTRKPIRVNIPHLPDDADEALIFAVQGFIDHEIGHVLDTDWDAVEEANVLGAKLGPSRGMTPKAGAQRLDNLHNIVEDPYVEAAMTKRFKGVGHNLDKLHDIFINRICKPGIENAKTPQDRFGCIIVPLVRSWAGQQKFTDLIVDNGYDKDPLVEAFVKAVPESVKARFPHIKDSWETLDLAKAIFDVICPEPPPPPPPQPSMADAINEEMKEQEKKEEKQPSTPSDEKSDDPDGEGDNQDKPEDEDDKGAGGEQSDEEQPSDQAGEGDAEKDEDADDAEGETPGKDAAGDKDEGDEDGKEGAEAEAGSEDQGEAGDGEGDEESDAEGDEKGNGGSDASDDEDEGDDRDDKGGSDAGDGDDDAEEDGDSGKSAGGSKGSGDDDKDEGDAEGDEGDDAEGDREEGKDEGAGVGSDEAGDDEKEAGDDPDDGRSEGKPDDAADGKDADGDDAASGDGDADDNEDDADGEVGSEGDGDDGQSREAGEKADAEDEASTGHHHTEQAPESSPFQGMEIERIADGLSQAIAYIITNEATRQIQGLDYRVYTTEWDVVEKFPTLVGDAKMEKYTYVNGRFGKVKTTMNKEVEALDTRTNHMVAPMQKDIERMMAARSQVLKVPGYRSGRLHSGSLHRLRTGDDRVFRRLEEHKSPETAVWLLIDNSGSMEGDKMRMAMSAGYALSSTLQRVGIKNAVSGFTTMEPRDVKDWHEQQEKEEERIGRQFSRYGALYLPVYKTFEERLTPEVKRRFAAAPFTCKMGGNCDGESVRNAGNRLALRPEPRKVLIVLSDGNPAAMSHFPEEIYSDVHKAVAECEKKQIETIGIGIMDEAVRTFYPKCVVLKDLAELPKAVMSELKRILTQ